jgi:hypothetical protein
MDDVAMDETEGSNAVVFCNVSPTRLTQVEVVGLKE